MSDAIKRIDIAEFRALGFLQEVNRLVLHPAGLALEVVVEDDGSEHLGGVWDYRDDPEGIVFGEQPEADKILNVLAERVKHADARRALMGAIVQPQEWPALGCGTCGASHTAFACPE